MKLIEQEDLRSQADSVTEPTIGELSLSKAKKRTIDQPNQSRKKSKRDVPVPIAALSMKKRGRPRKNTLNNEKL